MKPFSLALSWVILAAAGCASSSPATVGINAIQPSGRFDPGPNLALTGVLRVNTDTFESATGERMTYSLHTGFDIYDEHGRFLQSVENHRSLTDENLTDVPLAAGKYFVAIPDGKQPRFWIEVNIEDGKLTIADVTTLHSRR